MAMASSYMQVFVTQIVIVLHLLPTSGEKCHLAPEIQACGFDYCFKSPSDSGVEILSPNFPHPYPSNARCLWIIKAKFGKRIHIQFKSFDLQQSKIPGMCYQDYFIINDASYSHRYCGSTGPVNRTYVSTAPQVTLLFASNYDTNKKGFKLIISSKRIKDVKKLRKQSGIISSQYFPELYASSAFMVIKLKARSKQQINLVCKERFLFDNQSVVQNECGGNDMFVSFTESMTNAKRYCSNTTKKLSSPGRDMYIAFRSDYQRVNPKFACYYKFVKKSSQKVSLPVCECGRSPAPQQISPVPQPRIFGGEPSHYNILPWMVGILGRTYGYVICGGTLISPQYVLTAAHCFMYGKANPTHVVIGTYNPYNLRANKRIAIKSYTNHPMFDLDRDNDYDIAILHIDTPPEINENHTLCLPPMSTHSLLGYTATTYGWGKTHRYSGSGRDWLRKLTLPIADWYQCRDIVNEVHDEKVSSQNMICVSPTGKEGPCNGDSGGPLITSINNRQRVVGITIFVVKCGSPDYPSVYTRVSSFLPWILHHANMKCTPPP